MSRPLTSAEIAEAFERACLAELDALKPGNVHRHAPDARMTVADFERSAKVAAPLLAEPRLTVGRRISAGVEATIDEVGHNTNLGIILLAAPLAQAALAKGSGDLRQRVRQVLEHLTVADAREAYAAIRHARPGGLGEAGRHDVGSDPEITLLEAMRAAEDRDRIAWNYTHGFSDLFELGLPAFAAAAARGDKLPEAATSVYLGFLASIPDTLIARKGGLSRALEVQREALPLQKRLDKGMSPDTLKPELLSLDASLKERGLNPGTTADLTVATLFAVFLSALEMSK